MDTSSESSATDSTTKKNVFEDLSKEELFLKCKALLQIAHKAKQSKAELQKEVDQYKLLLEKSENDKTEYVLKAQTLQELVDSLTEQKLNYITQIDTVQSKITTLNSQCKTQVEEINNLKAELTLKSNSASDTSQKISDLDTEVTSLRRQNTRLEDENETLIKQLTELETKIVEFNEIGLQQREQLQQLEARVQEDSQWRTKVDELKATIKELQSKSEVNVAQGYENTIKELSHLYESEKDKKEKANVKLRSYKDKILKCAVCINQLKNSRLILSKTVKEYSENIPKWQNDILKASQVLDGQIKLLNSENLKLKQKIINLEKHINDNIQTNGDLETQKILDEENKSLQNQLSENKSELKTLNDQFNELQQKYLLLNSQLPEKQHEIEKLNHDLIKTTQMYENATQQNTKLNKVLSDLQKQNQELLKDKNNSSNSSVIETLNLQIRALESEKSILVKEKLTAKDSVLDLENQNKILTDQVKSLRENNHSYKTQIDLLQTEKSTHDSKYSLDRDAAISNLRCQMMVIQERYDLLKKDYDNSQDLNGLLKEEVETLKLSLEQPNDGADHLSDLNVSLQADIVKLETKLNAYKQENSSLLSEMKESRAKMKEFDYMVSEYEEAKSKLASYKSENSELLNEMKEINQALKERGEAISKFQKAIAEMETLIETLEQDRETLRKDKDDMANKITVLQNELQNAQQETNKHDTDNAQVVIEKENAMKCLSEKEILINNLKEEIEKLKQHQLSSDLPNEDMSTSTISKAEENSRMKDLDETFEDKYTKLRIFALKLKKKLNETVAQLQEAEQDKTRLQKMLTDNQAAIASSGSDEIDNRMIENKSEDIEESTVKIADLEHEIKTLKLNTEVLEKTVEETDNIKAELLSKTKLLTDEIQAHKLTKENLEKARRDLKKRSVLSLEMEDYEKSMKELTAKMEENKKKIIQMESTIDTQEGTITAMKTQIKLLEEQIKTEETQIRLAKEELQRALEQSKEKDIVIQARNDTISKLEQDLEDEKRKNEEIVLEITTHLSVKEKMIIQLGEEKIELNNKMKRMEYRCTELLEQLKISNIELEDLKTEYTSYKVRAQAVLRQNQTVDHSQEEQLKEETAALKTQIESLNAKLAASQQQCGELSAEVEVLRRRSSEATAEATRAQHRTARLHADLARLTHQADAERAQSKIQISTLTQCYKAQISELEAKLHKETDELRKQLAIAQEKAQADYKLKMSPLDSANRNDHYVLPVIPKDDSDGEMDINVSMIPREEGEGSESAPSPPLSKAFLSTGGGRRSPMPLERLLEEGVPEDDSMDFSSLALTPEQEISELKRKLTAQQQRVKHVTVLLSESERECARMAQLSELLKAELRRGHGSSSGAHNAEYMKNVTFKFVSLPPGDERSRLVPVLQQILSLSAEETQRLHAVAKGIDPSGKGWGSFLPWGGSK